MTEPITSSAVAEAVLIERASFSIEGNHELGALAANAIMQQLLEGDNEAFGEYPNGAEYSYRLRQNGLMIAMVNRPEGEHPEVIAKGSLIIGGMGDLAVANYEADLPAGVGHHEGYYTTPTWQALGLQRRIIGLVEESGRARGITQFTVALEPHKTTSQRNFIRHGYLSGIVFDPEYLAPPIGETARIPSFVGLKVADKKVQGLHIDERKKVIFGDQDNQDLEVFHQQIAELLDAGYVCISVKTAEDLNNREIPDSAYLTFVPAESLGSETARYVRRMQAQIKERLVA